MNRRKLLGLFGLAPLGLCVKPEEKKPEHQEYEYDIGHVGTSIGDYWYSSHNSRWTFKFSNDPPFFGGTNNDGSYCVNVTGCTFVQHDGTVMNFSPSDHG